MPIYGVAVQPVAEVLDIKTPKPLVSFKQIGFDYINSSEKFLLKKEGIPLQGPR
jgi:hypothetical protein